MKSIFDGLRKNFFKTNHIIFFIFLTSLSFLPLEALEENDEKEKEKKYSSSTSFSCVLTRGNNKDFSFSFDTEQNLHIKKSKLNLKGSIIYSDSDNQKKSEIYYSHLKYDREISSRAYLLGLIRAERNKLAGYNYRFALSLGAGYSWIKKKKLEISSEGAIGWSNENNSERIIQEVVDDEEDSITQRSFSASFASSIISSKLVYNFSSAAQFIHQEILFLNLSDLNDYRLNSNSSISASLSRYFALKTSIQIIYERKPVLGHKNTDFYLLSSIVIKI